MYISLKKYFLHTRFCDTSLLYHYVNHNFFSTLISKVKDVFCQLNHWHCLNDKSDELTLYTCAPLCTRCFRIIQQTYNVANFHLTVHTHTLNIIFRLYVSKYSTRTYYTTHTKRTVCVLLIIIIIRYRSSLYMSPSINPANDLYLSYYNVQ